ncbi:sugar ABC transporter substrate-binding protein [Mergibacter septicus]|uniref:polysaccharide biosynthesis/export family protein n=1 Tax=Mergibacter septicus TaxID=221402 RepID=UPI001179765B|nr:polysaccharide biosynthesis/export family protein [Mergibacter septicus]AWX13663.1 sugar ABC transporter substrate-binding protein [Mergibacter septicus]
MILKNKNIIFLIGCLVLTSCSLNPGLIINKASILDLNNQKETLPEVRIIKVDEKIVDILSEYKFSQSFSQFEHNSTNYVGAVNVGDVLDISIWETPPSVLFSAGKNNSGADLARLPEQMVSKTGKITIPFLGSVFVRGKTPEQIQTIIKHGLAKIANQPQIIVRLVKNNSANVTVLRQGNGIRMPLTAAGERVLDAVAAVGGVQNDLQDISVQLARDKQVKTIALERLTSEPMENIPLRSGDVLTLLNNSLSFTGLGALNNNRVIKFSARGLSLSEAIAKMGGLIDTRSDPQGVFVFRYVPFEHLSLSDKQKWKKEGYSSGMDIPTVYQVNLLEPKSLFWLQRFPMQDKDIVYVSNAPLAEFNKFLRMVFSITSPAIINVREISKISD